MYSQFPACVHVPKDTSKWNPRSLPGESLLKQEMFKHKLLTQSRAHYCLKCHYTLNIIACPILWNKEGTSVLRKQWPLRLFLFVKYVRLQRPQRLSTLAFLLTSCYRNRDCQHLTDKLKIYWEITFSTQTIFFCVQNRKHWGKRCCWGSISSGNAEGVKMTQQKSLTLSQNYRSPGWCQTSHQSCTKTQTSSQLWWQWRNWTSRIIKSAQTLLLIMKD